MHYIKIDLINHASEGCYALASTALLEVVSTIKDGSNARLIARPLNIRKMRGLEND